MKTKLRTEHAEIPVQKRKFISLIKHHCSGIHLLRVGLYMFQLSDSSGIDLLKHSILQSMKFHSKGRSLRSFSVLSIKFFKRN